MNEDDVLLTIRWTVADVKTAFLNKYGRDPTDDELEYCIDKLNIKALKDFSIENGWTFINDSVF